MKRIINFNPEDVVEIVVSHDDVFGLGTYSIGIKVKNGGEEVFHGDKDVLKVADYLYGAMPGVCKEIKEIVTQDLLFNNAKLVYPTL